LLKTLTAQWGATLFIGAASFLLTAYIARSIGPESFGFYSSALAAGSLLAIFIDGGMRTLVLRERSRPSEVLQSFQENLPGFAMAHALAIALMLWVVSFITLRNSQLQLACATILCFLMVALCQMTSSMLRGDGKVLEDAKFLVGMRAVTAIAIASTITLGWDSPWQIIATWSIAGLIWLIPYRSLWKYPKLAGLKNIYRASFPYLMIDLAITIYIRSDLLILNYFEIGSEKIGEFTAAFRICEAVILMAAPVGLLVFRYLRIEVQSRVALRRRISLLLIGSIGIGLLIAGIFWFFSRDLVSLVYGDKYPNSAEYLEILSLMLVFVMPNMILTQAALATAQEKLSMNVVIMVAIINVLLLAFLIPSFGIMTAVWVKVLTEAFMFSLLTFVLFVFGWKNLRSEN
jgi:O-antigen/teichoic acid export membrane protein